MTDSFGLNKQKPLINRNEVLFLLGSPHPSQFKHQAEVKAGIF